MDYDLIIIGSGIGGSALAAVMASAGYKVLALEQSLEFEDRVRGEWIAPWGVAETKRTGLYDALIKAGAHELKRHVAYDPAHDWEQAEEDAIPIASLLPDAGGPLTIGHPHHCQTLFDHAAASGATMLRGVKDADATLGAAPNVTYTHNGQTHTASCRLVVGAEGRTSLVRATAGGEVKAHKPHHAFAGMLIDDADAWPDDMQAVGTEGDVNFLAFPQGKARVRLYACFPLDQRHRFQGEGGQQRFLEAMDMQLSPRMKALAGAKPAGPVMTYFNHGSDGGVPYAQGAVLVGDAAGWSDPILGQGLSVTHRDVRIVSEILKENEDWSKPDLMAPYHAERQERMRRIHFSCDLLATRDAEFGPESDARRAAYPERVKEDPSLAISALSSLVGVENMPAEAFTEESRQRVLNG